MTAPEQDTPADSESTAPASPAEPTQPASSAEPTQPASSAEPTQPAQSQKKICPDLTNAVWHGSDEATPPGGGRIEVAFVEDMICMRNGEDPNSPVLVFTKAEWDAFVEGAKDGEFDLPME